MRNCILLTSEFPYLSGEPFLSAELEILCKVFDNIYVFSINANEGMSPTKSVPKNCKVFCLDGATSKFKYIRYAVSGIAPRSKSFKTNNLSLKERLSSVYFRGRAKAVYKSILDRLIAEKIDVQNSIIYSFWFSYQAGAAMLLKEHFEKQGISTRAYSRAHGYDLYWERTFFNYQPYQDELLKKLDAVLTCSQKGKEYLLDKYPWAKRKISVSRLGTKDYGVTKYTPNKTIATCCNLNAIKRMDLFAKAFCLLSKTDPDARWICIGDGEQLPAIKNIINNEHLENRVEFCGFLNQEEIIKIYKNNPIKYFCNVSTTEGVPVSIMEAQSFGIPVIATDVGGTSEIACEDNGLLISPDLEPEKLAEILHDAININDKTYLSLRKKVRERWELISKAESVYGEFVQQITND